MPGIYRSFVTALTRNLVVTTQDALRGVVGSGSVTLILKLIIFTNLLYSEPMNTPPSPDIQLCPVSILEELKAKGYTADLRPADGGRVLCGDPKLDVAAEALTIDEIRRFEGASNPGDSSIIIAASIDGKKGVLMLGYGPAASRCDASVLEKIDS
jgi:hypothetical protein